MLAEVKDMPSVKEMLSTAQKILGILDWESMENRQCISSEPVNQQHMVTSQEIIHTHTITFIFIHYNYLHFLNGK